MELERNDKQIALNPETLPVEFREHPKDFKFEGIRLGGNFALMAVPWRENGRSGMVWIPVLDKNEGLYEGIAKMGESLGNDFWKEKELGGLEGDRIKLAVNKMKLPMILAVHMAMNRPDLWEEDKAEIVGSIKEPNADVEVPVAVGVIGPARVGKSMLVAGLSVEPKTKVLCLTPKETGAEVYATRVKAGMSGVEIENEVLAIRKDRGGKKETEIFKEGISIKSRLDDVLDGVLMADERPDVFMVDTRALSMRSKVLPGEIVLPADSFHIAAMEALEAIVKINAEDVFGMESEVNVLKNNVSSRLELMLMFGLDYLMNNLLGDNSLRITGEALEGMMALVNENKQLMLERGRQTQKEFLASLKER